MILLFFTFIFFLVYYVWKRRNLLRLASKIKGPIGYPVIGSAYRFLNAASKYALCCDTLSEINFYRINCGL